MAAKALMRSSGRKERNFLPTEDQTQTYDQVAQRKCKRREKLTRRGGFTDNFPSV